MQALILAAGICRRMKPLSDFCHKTLMEINGVTILGRILDSLIMHNITNISIVVGYKAETIKEFVNLNYQDKATINFILNDKYAETNNIYSLHLALECLSFSDDLILIESDLYYEDKIISQLINNPNPNVALVDRYRSGMDGTVVELLNGRVKTLYLPSMQDNNFNFFDKYKTLNIYKFSYNFTKNQLKRTILLFMENNGYNEYYEAVLGMLLYSNSVEIYTEIVENSRWIEIDDPNDLKKAQYMFEPNKKYEILKNQWGGYWNFDILDFNFIRNMYFPTESMFAALKNFLSEILQNYGTNFDSLIKKFNFLLEKNYLGIVPLNGASQIYPFIQEYFNNSNVLVPTPSFGEYTRIFNKSNIFHYNGFYDNDSIDEISNKLSSNKIDLLIIVNPNNPTGSELSSTKIVELMNKYKKTYFLIDESFHDFSRDKSILNFDSINDLNNLIYLKSLSKSLGTPGIRLGFTIINDTDIYLKLKQHVGIWYINSLAEYMIEILLKFKKEFKLSIEKTINDRENFINILKSQTWVFHVFPSNANFILVETSYNFQDLEHVANELLIKHNLMIKVLNIPQSGSPRGFMRLAVRKNEENLLFIELINSIIKQVMQN